jgi:hypothetical protein
VVLKPCTAIIRIGVRRAVRFALANRRVGATKSRLNHSDSLRIANLLFGAVREAFGPRNNANLSLTDVNCPIYRRSIGGSVPMYKENCACAWCLPISSSCITPCIAPQVIAIAIAMSQQKDASFAQYLQWFHTRLSSDNSPPSQAHPGAFFQPSPSPRQGGLFWRFEF